MESYKAQRYERLLESLDEYLTQDFGDGSNGFDDLEVDLKRAIGDMKVYPTIILGNIKHFEQLVNQHG